MLCRYCHEPPLMCCCLMVGLDLASWDDGLDLEPLGVDHNGCPTERLWLAGGPVIVHHGEVPASDITTVDGIPCTTAFRTVIDLAGELTRSDLDRILRDALGRRLFTVDEAHHRLDQPDMARHPGAAIVRAALPPR
jgi:hypothetical protein